MNHMLDRFIWHALSGRQQEFSQGNDLARRFAPDYGPFAATRDDSHESLAALHAILPDGARAALVTPGELVLPDTLTVLRRAAIGQLILPVDAIAGDIPPLPPATRALGASDAPAMMALVALTNPGPFAERTLELGRYLGVFEGETLIAMAGERMCLDGFVEISAVCTHPNHRGRRLSAALIGDLARAAFDRGETPFLHAFADNAPALAVYRKLGFTPRAMLHMTVVGRAEQSAPAPAAG
jgi:predicted GNAT family acetyltransferase